MRSLRMFVRPICLIGALSLVAATAVTQESDSSGERVRSGFLPGVAGSLVQPFEVDSLYTGVDFHYAFAQGIVIPQDKQEFGGFYELYAEIGFYKERASAFNDDIFFTYAAGVSLSFEKFYSYSRSFLVPYFGAKLGGLFINNAGGGFLLEPLVGTVVFLTEYFNVNYNAALLLNTVDLSGFIGLHHSVVVNFNL